MRVTARFWTIAAIAAVLITWAVIVEQFVPLIGAAGVCAWLLAQQVQFINDANAVVHDLHVHQTTARAQIPTGESTLVTITVKTEDPVPVSLAVEPSFPAGAEAPDDVVAVERGEDNATATFDVTWPVAGVYELDTPQVTARDRLGLFEQSVTMGTTPRIRVEPRAPRNVHVGEGGEPIVAGFGEHEAGQIGSGLEPAEVRKYVPGDTVRNIDWKATARLGEPHVREFEAETDRETVLLVDHRAAMGTGHSGETKLDYVRQVALAFVESAQELSDPLGCVTVGDDGFTGTYDPSANIDHQQAIRRHLQAIDPTDVTEQVDDQSGGTAPGRARVVNQRLGDDTAFDRRLKPFFERPETYVQRVVSQPLVESVRSVTSRLDGVLWSVIITDDSHPTELREAVKLARQGEGRVLVFIAPTVLYEPGGLGDLEEAYDRYAEFEHLRTALASMERVSAFEVGPADRVSAVLASGTRQRENTWSD